MGIRPVKAGLLFIFVALLLLGTPLAATAQGPDREAPSDIEAILWLLVQKGIVTEAEAEALLRRKAAEDDPAGADSGDPATAAPPPPDAPPDRAFQEVREQLERKIDNVQSDARRNQREIERLELQRIQPLADGARKSGWAQRIRFGGDLRLRYQKDMFDEDNPLYGDANSSNPEENLINSTQDRDRLRARVRLDLNADLVDPRDKNVGLVTVGLRLSTGNERDPVSTNETLGDYFNKDAVMFDRYFLHWRYKPIEPVWGRIPRIGLTGGRMPNPWFSTDLVWNDELNFEGVALNLQSDTLQENPWRLFLTAGAFPLQEVELSSHDKWLLGVQLGVQAEPVYGLSFKIAGAYYDFQNIAGEANELGREGERDFTAPPFIQRGNTLMDIDPGPGFKRALAADFRLIDVTASLDWTYFFPVHIILEANYVRNIGFDLEAVTARAFVADSDTEREILEANEGYRVGLKVGYPTIRLAGEWNLAFHYKYLEADAVVDAFTDSSFHLGGTNAKGWIAAAELGLYKDVWMRARWLTANEAAYAPFAIDVFQLDVNARF